MKKAVVLILLTISLIVYFFIDGGFLSQEQSKISDQKIPKPENFIQIKRDIQKGIFYGLENLSEEYYLQPDFYPSYKNSSDHDYTRWGVHGYGAYPGTIAYNIKNFKRDQYINVYTFIKTSENIETFQGIKFNIDILNYQDIKNNKSEQNNSQLFDIFIDPNTVMLTPTFPERSEYVVESRTYNWAYKLKITIAANVDIPTGTYEFKLKASSPDENAQRLFYQDIQKINQKWYSCPENNNDKCNDNIVELRKKVYVDGEQFQADRFFNIIVSTG